ncbi:MAG TPA: hypothetical protein ENH23_03855 [candidate division Zixibacteria bacterium]|nr:hypothetical protein [candidate division Zixibacteria bacterium]
MKERLYVLDWIRVFAIFYIIFVWHIDDYSNNIFSNMVTSTLAYICLYVFVFVSSYLLACNYTISKPKEIIAFIKKRAVRVYPLYLLALIMFLMTSQISLKEFLIGAFLLNMILNTSLLTLWFISMIFIFYLLLSVILYNYSLIRTVYISFAFSLLCYILHKTFGLISPKLVYYYPAFFVGIFCAKRLHIDFKWGKSKIIALLSYSTFCMYLFHRIIYWGLLKIYIPDTNAMIVVYLACAGIPALYFVSTGLQAGYDKIVSFSFRVDQKI